MARKILVTGGSGTLGAGFKVIAKKQYNKDEFVFWSSKDCNLTNIPETIDKVGKIKPDVIIHLAAISGGIGLTAANPATIMRDNLLMDIAILESARAHGIKKLAMSLSVAIYSPEADMPLKEKNIHQGVPHESAESYAFSKRLLQPLIKAYRTEYDLSVIGLIPNGIFGPHDHYNAQQGTMLASLIARFYQNRDNTDPIVVWGDGTPLREYTYAPDLAKAYMWAVDHYDDEQVLNIGSNEECSISSFAHFIADAIGIDRTRITFDTSKPNGVHRRPTDNSKFVELSGYKYASTEEGVKSTVEWYVKTMETNPKILRTQSKLLRS